MKSTTITACFQSLYLITLFLLIQSCTERPVSNESASVLCDNEQLFINAPDSFRLLEIDYSNSSMAFFDSLRSTIRCFTRFRIKHKYIHAEDSTTIYIFIPFSMVGGESVSIKTSLRNVFEIRLNNENKLLVEGEYCSLDTLGSFIKRNVLNYGRQASLADASNKANISFRWEVDSSLNSVRTVLNIIVSAYLDVAQEQSLLKYGQSLCELPKDSVLILQDIFPLNLIYRGGAKPKPIFIESIVKDEPLLSE
jgi:hypothetical protein